MAPSTKDNNIWANMLSDYIYMQQNGYIINEYNKTSNAILSCAFYILYKELCYYSTVTKYSVVL